MGKEVCRMTFIRHGPTVWNKLNLIQSSTNIPLDHDGLAHAKDYAFALRSEKIHAVISSPLMRAWQTGLVVAKGRNLPVEIEYGLTERSFGKFLEGTDYRTSRDKRHNFLVDQSNNPMGIETDESLRERVLPALKSIIHAYMGMNVLVISHSSLMRFLIKEFGGRTYQDMANMPIDNGSMIKVFGDGREIVASPNPWTVMT